MPQESPEVRPGPPAALSASESASDAGAGHPYRALIALNAVLIGVLALVTLAPAPGGDAQAQANRARGDYTMVAGRIQGSSEDAIFIVDSNNAEVVAVRWQKGAKEFAGVGYQSFNSTPQRGGRRR
jgi:hypothetical protein